MNIVLALEPFWQQLASLPHLGLLRRTSTPMRADCDPQFVVKAMGANREITKKWAMRWLGLSASWLNLGEKLTLSLALKIAAEHGGLPMTYRRGAALRDTEERQRQEKAQAIADKRQEEIDASQWDCIQHHITFNLRVAELDIAIERAGLPKEKKQYEQITDNALFRFAQAFDVSEHLRRYRAALDRLNAQTTLRAERKAILDARLEATNTPREGKYYENIVFSLAFAELTDQAAEITFRYQCERHPGLDEITERLAHLRRVKHTGLTSYHSIRNDVYARFRTLYSVGEDGTIGERVRTLRPLRPKD